MTASGKLSRAGVLPGVVPVIEELKMRAWIKRRARRLMRAFSVSRAVAVSSAAEDWKYMRRAS